MEIRIGRIIGISLLSIVFWVGNLLADVQVSAEVDKTEVCTGSSFIYSIVISGDIKDYELPDKISIPGAKVYGRGSSQQITVRNGKVSNTVRLNFVVMPLRTGEITIPSLEVKVNNRVYITPEKKVVVKDCVGARVHQRRFYGVSRSAGPPIAQPEEGQTDTFATISLSKEKVYLGEPLILTYTIYTRSRVAYKGFAKKPYFEGFVQEEVLPGEDMNRREVVIGGRRYVAVDVMRFVLVPTQTGRLVINPGSLLLAETSRMRDVFRDFFSDSFWDTFFDEDFFTTERQFEINLPNREVEVVPLPEKEKPKDFSGLVGDFSLRVKVDKDKIHVGESITLRIEVKGSGPLSSLDSIPIEVEGARVYKSSSSSSMDMINGKPVYQKVFEYIILPDKPGKLQIPPIRLNFFSPTQKTYKEISHPEIEIQVLPNKDLPSSSNLFLPSKQTNSFLPKEKNVGIRRVGEDIRFIKEELTLQDDKYWRWFWIVNLVIAIVVLGWIFKDKIKSISILLCSTSREKAELERLISVCESNPESENLRKLLDKILKLASQKGAKDKINSFQSLGEKFEEWRETGHLADAFLFGNFPLSEEEKKKILETIKKVMKHLVLVVGVTLSLFCFPSLGLTQDSPEIGFDAGNSLYRAGDYQGAIREYERLLSQGIQSFEVYYNLGNAYVKSGNLERALLYYLKAFKINPLDSDLRYNIKLVKKRLGVEDLSSGFWKWFLFPPKIIATIISVLFWITLFLSLSKISPVKKFTLLLLTVVSLLIAIVWLVMVLSYLNRDAWLVMKKTSLYSAPSEKESKLAILNSGIEVEKIRDLGNWIQIKAPDGIVGWVKKTAVEKI